MSQNDKMINWLLKQHKDKIKGSKFDIRMNLTEDTPSSMTFEDTREGLKDIWYKFKTNENGDMELIANEAGFEHLARVFLKMSKGKKSKGFHFHTPIEYGKDGSESLKITFELGSKNKSD